VSDTTEFLTTPHGTSEPADSPSGSSRDEGSGPAAGVSKTTSAATARRGIGVGLASMKLAELQQLAQQMGIKGTGRMRKGEVITAIQEKQGGGAARAVAKDTTARRAAAGTDAARTALEPEAPAQLAPAQAAPVVSDGPSTSVRVAADTAAPARASDDQLPFDGAASPAATSDTGE